METTTKMLPTLALAAALGVAVLTPVNGAAEPPMAAAADSPEAPSSGGGNGLGLQTKTLANGLTVIAIPDHSLPIVTVELALRHGAFAESEEFDGLSHLYEHMFFKGNAEIPDQEAYLQRINELGIVFNGSTSTERVNYFYTLPREHLRGGMDLMMHSVTSPTLDPKEFQREKQVVLSEYDRAESQPSYAFDRAMRRELWYEYPHRKIALGSREAIENATVDQMRTLKERYYVPNNAALLVAGDIEPGRAFDLAGSVFGNWESGADPLEAHPIPEHPPLEEPRFLHQTGDVEVPTVDIRWQGPSVDEDPEATYAADVLSFILSQPSSRFQKKLVESQIALDADLSYYTQKYTGPINASAEIPADRLKKGIELLLRELHALSDPDYFTDQQLENAKAILEARDLYGREKTSSFTHTVSFWWAVDDLGYYRSYVDNLQAVTREDIVDYVEDYILDDPYVLGLLLNEKAKQKTGLDREALVELVERVEADIEEGNGRAANGPKDTSKDDDKESTSGEEGGVDGEPSSSGTEDDGSGN